MTCFAAAGAGGSADDAANLVVILIVVATAPVVVPDGAAAVLFKNMGYSGFGGGVGALLDSGVRGACFLGDASFFKFSSGDNKAEIVVPCFEETFTSIPTCEFIDFKFSLRRQGFQISRDQVQGSFRSTSSYWVAMRCS